MSIHLAQSEATPASDSQYNDHARLAWRLDEVRRAEGEGGGVSSNIVSLALEQNGGLKY